jgi:cell volume regulation protein A
LGGSGFLAVYVAGVVIRNRLKRPIESILHFGEALQWLSQIALFLMLGLLVTPSDLIGGFPGALSVAAVLMFVARPVAVMSSICWFGFTLREQIYIGWVGLRGAVPIFLAIMPIVTPGPVTTEFFNIVFVIVVASLVVQGWTIGPAARWLGVADRGQGLGRPGVSA